jgi:hypothetical protein
MEVFYVVRYTAENDTLPWVTIGVNEEAAVKPQVEDRLQHLRNEGEQHSEAYSALMLVQTAAELDNWMLNYSAYFMVSYGTEDVAN